jgi:hypothetical protein
VVTAVFELRDRNSFEQFPGCCARRLRIVGMNQIDVRPRQQLLLRVAENGVPGGIHSLQIAIVTGDADQIGREREQEGELIAGALVLDEQADLSADGAQHVEQGLVGLADLAAEELHHAEHFASHQDREPEGGMQAFPRGDSCPREVRV